MARVNVVIIRTYFFSGCDERGLKMIKTRETLITRIDCSYNFNVVALCRIETNFVFKSSITSKLIIIVQLILDEALISNEDD